MPLDQPCIIRSQFDQDALNYSKSQVAASSPGDSHHGLQRRLKVMDSATESGFTTEEASYYSYYSMRDPSAFVKEIDGR